MKVQMRKGRHFPVKKLIKFLTKWWKESKSGGKCLQDLFSLGGLFSGIAHRVMILLRILAFKSVRLDNRNILYRISQGLQWKNKPPELKRSIFMFFSSLVELASSKKFEVVINSSFHRQFNLP